MDQLMLDYYYRRECWKNGLASNSSAHFKLAWIGLQRNLESDLFLANNTPRQMLRAPNANSSMTAQGGRHEMK
jgi:hypothetical protein